MHDNWVPLQIWLGMLVFFTGLMLGVALMRSYVRLLVLRLIAQRSGGLWFNALRDVYIHCGGGDGDIPRQDYE